jgi:uncharacterized membrane protein YfcA
MLFLTASIVLLLALLFSMLGLGGARLMKEKMKAAWIKKMFAGVLLAVSVKLFLKVLL